MISFICPVCKTSLNKEGKTYRCENNHSFDMAKSGYVNLLLSNQMNTKNPGDNKLMVNARRDFLSRGYYSRLLNVVSEKAADYCKGYYSVIYDCGCGEGYYTNGIYEKLESRGIPFKISGIDISKNAITVAAKRNKAIDFAVGSVFKLPFPDNRADILITMFAPYCGEEYLRVLKKEGIMIMVIPDENHLLQLKEAIYEKPYKNEVKDLSLEGFSLLEDIPVGETIHLSRNQDIENLFKMTPYYYKTGIVEQQRVEKLTSLDTEISFRVLIYKA